jgi:predicted amidohydrolase
VIPAEYEGFEQVVTVGCVNFTPVWGDKKRTMAKIEANVVEAAAQGIDLVVFPEGSLTGASGCDACRAEGGPCDTHVELAETIPGPATEHVADLAREHDLYVVFGMPERDAQEPRVLYNSAAVIGPDGLLGRYRKVHLGTLPWVTEGIVFRPGTELPVFPTRFGPIGVQICYDFWFNPELSRILALKGARLIVNACGTFAGPGKRDYMVQTTSVRAQENLVYAASANLVGGPGHEDYGAEALDDVRPSDYLGHSVIAGPAFPRFSHVYAEAGDGEEIVSATLSFEKLHRWQSVFPMRDWRLGRQLDATRLVAEEFQRLAR